MFKQGWFAQAEPSLQGEILVLGKQRDGEHLVERPIAVDKGGSFPPLQLAEDLRRPWRQHLELRLVSCEDFRENRGEFILRVERGPGAQMQQEGETI